MIKYLQAAATRTATPNTNLNIMMKIESDLKTQGRRVQFIPKFQWKIGQC